MSKKDNPIHLALFQTFAALLLEFLKVVTTHSINDILLSWSLVFP